MRILTSVVLLICFQFVFAQKSKLDEVLLELKSDPVLKHSQFSYCITQTKTGKVLASYNSLMALVPASTLKTITTTTALSILGADYKYKTKIYYSGKFDSLSGVLNGDIIIEASGDPTIQSSYFYKEDSTSIANVWAKKINARGIKEITGKLIVLNSCFEDQALPNDYIWADMGNYFGAGTQSFSYKDNKYVLYFNSTEDGKATEIIKTKPAYLAEKFDNQVKAGGSGDNTIIYGSHLGKNKVIKGTIPANKSNYEVEGSMDVPAFYFMQDMQVALTKLKIKCNLSLSMVNDKGLLNNARLIYTHSSPALSRIVYFTNQYSDNHFAETLLKTLALQKYGKGTTLDGIKVVSEFLKSKQLDAGSLFQTDGSGLSRSNTITTQLFCEVLNYVAKDQKMYEVFNKSLPIAGQDHLSSLCKGTKAENNLRAKSGYINRARSYAGFINNSSGELLSFSIIFNNYDCSPKEAKTRMERIMNCLFELSP